jgi:hypothetical protein
MEVYHDNKSTTKFAKQLSREISKFPSREWKRSFLDYEKLRKQIQKTCYYEKQCQQHFNEELYKKIVQSHQIFWSILKYEIEKINLFFIQQHQLHEKTLNEIIFDENEHLSVIFVKILVEHLTNINKYIPIQLRNQAKNFSFSNIDSNLIQTIKSFIEICKILDQLRKYVVLNYLTLWRIIKQYQQHTDIQMQPVNKNLERFVMLSISTVHMFIVVCYIVFL